MGFAPSDRFSLSDAPNALPHKCAVCGYAASGSATEPDDKRQYLDFGLDIDYYGTVYLCTTCLNDAISGLGYLSPADADSIRHESEIVKTELIRLRSAVEVINGLTDVLTSSGWIANGNVSDSDSGELVTPEDAQSGPDDDSSAAEQVTIERSDDTSDSGSLLI